MKLTLSFSLVVEMICYYLVSGKVKDYSSYCLNLNASFVNLIAVAISYSWYGILYFNFFEWMPDIVFKFRHASWSISSGWRKRYQISIGRKTLICCLYPLLAGRKHWPGNYNQGNFILSPWQISWLFIWFYTPNAWWGEKSSRIIQVNTIGLIWLYID